MVLTSLVMPLPSRTAVHKISHCNRKELHDVHCVKRIQVAKISIYL
jgi:hypothetical protein